MTDRVYAITVALSEDLRTDDVRALMEAISMLKGVAEVGWNISDPKFFAAQARARQELGQAVWKTIYPDTKVTIR